MSRLRRSEQFVGVTAASHRDPRPAEHFDAFHKRTREREPDAVYEAVRILATMWAFSFFRARSISSDKVPQSGPVILAPNHGSFMDHFLLAAFVRRKIRFMAKSQLFQPPAQWIYTHGGVFPLRRGHRDEEAFITARMILERGGTVAMYCEGARSRDGKLNERPKPGIGRLALETGAAVVPVAIYGSSKVRNWRKGEFPKVTVQYGDPIRWETVQAPTRDQQMAVTEEVFGDIKILYAGLESLGRKGVLARVREQRRLERRRGKKHAATV
ncbi:MAG: lysophospholipid acyltransferase family protein [Solirubrobacteraceae bacterium]